MTHIRDGVELELPLGRQNYYDWWYQGTSGAPNEMGRKLLPGDRLITHCYYDTKNSESWHDRGGTLVSTTDTYFPFGEGTDEEMCFNFIAYYPRHPQLTSCFHGFGIGEPSERFSNRRERQLRDSSSIAFTQDQASDIQRVLTSARTWCSSAKRENLSFILHLHVALTRVTYISQIALQTHNNATRILRNT